MTVGTTPSPNLGELEQVLESRKMRLAESLRASRAELLTKLALLFQDLALPQDLSDLIRFERVTLAAFVEIVERLSEVEQLEAGYARTLSERTRETEEAKASFERANPLTQAIERQRSVERFLSARMEVEVYGAALESIRSGKEAAERSLQAARQRLTPSVREYLHARKSLLIEEAERNIEQARGQLRQAEGMRQRAERVTAEFVTKYGWNPDGLEGEHGATAN